MKQQLIHDLLRAEATEQATWRTFIPSWHPRNDVSSPTSIEEYEERQKQIRERLQELDAEYSGQVMPEGGAREWNALNEELGENNQVLREMRKRKARLDELARQDAAFAREGENIDGADFNVRRSSMDIYDVWAVRSLARGPEEETKILRENASRAVEQAQFPDPNIVPEEARERISRLFSRFEAMDEGLPFGQESNVQALSRRILLTGSPTYKRAFGRALTGRALSPEEQRALSLTNTAGGFAVPFTLDPTVIHTSNYSVNPWRAIARTEQIATTTWQGITSGGISVSRVAELTQASDNAPTLAQPSVTPQRVQGFIPFSIEIGQDWGALQTEMTSMLQEAKDDEEATSFATGGGTAPAAQGILTGATNLVTTAGTGAFAIADIYAMEAALPPRFRPRAVWFANKGMYNNVRQFDTGGGGGLWLQVAPLGRGLETNLNNGGRGGQIGAELIGYPAYEASPFATDLTTGNHNKIMVLGDFRYFIIVDRIGMDVELIPHLFGASGRPLGQRGIYAIWRNNSAVLSAGAFVVLIVR
jgi:HK97 family phage major capsid protein